MITNLYIHIPFCSSICSYCDFKKVKYDKEIADHYISLLENDILKYVGKLDVSTIYIGGGTPSILSEEQIDMIRNLLTSYINLKNVKEFTFECNPEDVTFELATKLKEIGVNRISLGCQTFNDKLLANVNRRHDSKQTIRAFNTLREAGIKNISIDLIYGLEGQTQSDIEHDLKSVALLMPEHVSWYSLIIKEDTELEGKEIDIDHEEKLMETAFEGLRELGYKQYETSSFALSKSCQSEHNKSYWLSKNWLGIGWGASSHIDGKLIENVGSVVGWKDDVTTQNESEYYFQTIMMGLRYFDGIDITVYPYKEAYEFYQAKIHKLLLEGFVEILDGRLRVAKGQNMILDHILISLL